MIGDEGGNASATAALVAAQLALSQFHDAPPGDPQAEYDCLVSHAVSVVPEAELAGVALLQDGLFVAPSVSEAGGGRLPALVDGGLLARCLAHGGAMLLRDAGQLTPEEASAWRRGGVGSMIVVPFEASRPAGGPGSGLAAGPLLASPFLGSSLASGMQSPLSGLSPTAGFSVPGFAEADLAGFGFLLAPHGASSNRVAANTEGTAAVPSRGLSAVPAFGAVTPTQGVLQLVSSRPGGLGEEDLLRARLLVGMLGARSRRAPVLRRAAGPEPQTLLGAATDRIEVLSESGVIVWMNHDVMPLATGELRPGGLWIESWPEADRAEAAAALADARAGRIGHFRAGTPAPDTERWWDVVVTRAPEAHATLLCVARDMTDLHEAAERTTLALEAGSVIGIAVWEAGRLSLDQRLMKAFRLPATITLSDFLRRVHRSDRERLRALGRGARSGSGELSAVFRIRRPEAPQDGIAGWRWMEARGTVDTSHDGKLLRLIGVLIDVHARKRVELELAQNELAVRQVADSMPIQLAYIAPNLTFRFANRAYIAWFGEPEDGYPETPVETLFGETLDEGQGLLLRRALAGERIRFDSQVRTSYGKLCDVDMEYIPRRDGVGEFDGCYVIAFDITKRKEEERALSRSNTTLEQNLAVVQQESEQVWRLSRDLLCVRDAQWRLRSVNPAWSSALGWSDANLLDSDCSELLHPDDAARTDEHRLSVLTSHEVTGFENRYRTRAGQYRWLSWNVVHADGLIYGAARDITAEKEAAQRVQRIEEQLRQSQKMEAVGQLTGGIAHDFNNLLTGVIGSLEMMRSRVQQGRVDEVGKYMDAAAGAAERAAAVTHRLLAFSSRQTLSPMQVPADKLVHDMDELIRNAAGPLATMQVVRHPGIWRTFCDPRQLEIAVLNLVTNARDAMPEGGRMVIETANAVFEKVEFEGEVPAGEYVAVSVTDTGCGMSPEVAARAFDPFFTTKPIGRGTGLGLSMVYGFARQSGGHVRIATSPARGARVSIYLPRSIEGEVPAEPVSSPALRGRTVLLVEDEPMVRMLIGEALAELECEVIEAVDAPGGVRVLQGDGRIDLLITDFGLPGGMNGRQLAESARGLRPSLKVLFITGHVDRTLLEAEAAADSATQVIGKPFTLEALTDRVLALVPL